MQHTHYLFKSTQQHCGHYMGGKGHSYQMYLEVQTDVFYKDIGSFFSLAVWKEHVLKYSVAY